MKTFKLAAALIAFAAAHGADTRQMRSFSVEVQGHGIPVILIPGLSCTAEVWSETVAHLNAEGYQTHALTIAGFGGTAPVKAENLLANVRDDIAAYSRQYHLHHPVLIGHSLGGYLALSVASTYPELPSKIVSVDGLPYLAGVMMGGAAPEQVTQQAQALRSAMLSGPASQFDTMTRQSDEAMISSPVNIEREFNVNRRSDRATVAEAMYEMLTNDLRPALSKARAPILEIGTWIAYKQMGATHDASLSSYRAQFATAPSARVIMTDDAKHFVMLDTPDWLYKQVDDFLRPS